MRDVFCMNASQPVQQLIHILLNLQLRQSSLGFYSRFDETLQVIADIFEHYILNELALLIFRVKEVLNLNNVLAIFYHKEDLILS